MSDRYLHRDGTPFGVKIWEKIDATVTGVARARLSARRLLEIEGPYGYALQALFSDSEAVSQAVPGDVRLRVPRAFPVPSLECPFRLVARDLAAFEETGLPLDLGAAARAAAACADQEDALLFYGSEALGLTGLANTKGVQSVKLASWKTVGAALDNVLQAVDKLDAAGYHGPYALALPPALFNPLIRLYPQTGRSELEQLNQAVSGGVVKAACLDGAGVLVTAVKEIASIAIGRDMETAFVGPAGRDYEFTIAESLALRLRDPKSVCVLK